MQRPRRESGDQSTMDRLTRAAAGVLVSTANSALDSWWLGAQTSARTAGRLAREAQGIIPGAKLAGGLAAVVEKQAGEGRRRTDQLARIAAESGRDGLQYLSQLLEALLRAGYGEPRDLGRLIEHAIRQARELADLGEMAEIGGLVPEPLSSPQLQHELRRIAENPPHRLLQALAERPAGPAGLVDLLAAAAEDAEALRILLLTYPLVLARLGGGTGRLLWSGDADLGEFEAFWRGRRFETWRQ